VHSHLLKVREQEQFNVEVSRGELDVQSLNSRRDIRITQGECADQDRGDTPSIARNEWTDDDPRTFGLE
jgi:hypothetical protein